MVRCRNATRKSGSRMTTTAESAWLDRLCIRGDVTRETAETTPWRCRTWYFVSYRLFGKAVTHITMRPFSVQVFEICITQYIVRRRTCIAVLQWNSSLYVIVNGKFHYKSSIFARQYLIFVNCRKGMYFYWLN